MNKHLLALIPLAVALLVACGPKSTEVEPGTSSGTSTSSSSVLTSSSIALSSGVPLSSGAQSSSGTVASSGAVHSSGVVTSSTGTSATSSGATSSAGTSSVPGSSAGTSSAGTSSSATTSSTTPSSSSATTTSSSSWNPFNPLVSYGTYTDTRDNKVYKTAIFNTSYEIFVQNLDYGTQISGSSEQNNDAVEEKYCYNDDPANCVKYGGLYQWAEAMKLDYACNTNLTGSANCPQTLADPPAIGGADSRQHQGLCPNGWHILNGDGWNDAGMGNSTPGCDFRAWGVGWSGSTCNRYGFSAVPSGTRANISPYFGAQGTLARWWTAVEINPLAGTERKLTATGDVAESANVSKYLGLAIRCAKNY